MKKLPIFLLLLFTFFFQNVVFAQDNEKISLANEYYNQGEMEKALSLFEELAKEEQNITFIHNNYFKLLIDNRMFKDAQRYLRKTKRRFPDNVYYQIDQVVLYQKEGDKDKAAKELDEVIEQIKGNQYKLQIAAQHLVKNQMIDQAVAAYKAGRKARSDENAYALQLANLYRLQQNKDLMVEEYLHFLDSNPSHLNYVENILQNILTEEEDMLAFEQKMYDKIQKNPENRNYAELIIWLNLQQKNFYQAFVQAKAVDKRWQLQGKRSLEIGQIALENKDYDMAIEIFEYVTKNYQNHPNYFMAKAYLVNAREEKVKHTYPVDKESIRVLITEYGELIEESGGNKATAAEAKRRKALLHAFYLDEKEQAISILDEVIHTPGVQPRLKAHCKLDLGDIYLLKGEPWESTLLYSQVEKEQKDAPLGYEAKLRNAKLNYYSGDFQLAQEHLDVLKLATTREIANDAMSLSLLIKDNTVLDSTDVAMKEYARIELILFQNEKEKALKALDQMLENYPQHSLTDEIYWLKAKINLEYGEFNLALNNLQGIITNYRQDILSDDAAFLRAKIYEESLNDTQKAMELYKSFMLDYPGSIYTSEARKRFRKLRGDFIAPPQ